MYKIAFFLFLFSITTICNAQVIGGESVYQFLRLANSTQATAMGGMVVSNPSEDVGLALSNPALLRPIYNQHIGIYQNFHFSGATFTNLIYAKHAQKINTTFAGSINYLNHGSMVRTNANGQNLGTLSANELCIGLTASKNYQKKWRYGAGLKFVNSQLANLSSAGIMADAGLVYFDTTKQFYFGMLVKNIGFQLSKYSTQSGREPLPFDMQIAVTKKFIKAPFRLNAIVHHLYQWDIRYDNPLDKVNNSFLVDTDTTTSNYTIDKFFRHFNFGVDLVLSKNFEINVGYNHLRRSELGYSQKLGLSGFSFGAIANFKKIQVQYARVNYNTTATNEIGITLKTQELFGWDKKIKQTNLSKW